jgi:hypothetical protein
MTAEDGLHFDLLGYGVGTPLIATAKHHSYGLRGGQFDHSHAYTGTRFVTTPFVVRILSRTTLSSAMLGAEARPTATT